MHLSRIFDFGYDLVPTLVASSVVLLAVLRDRARRRRGSNNP
ncbi:MAG TPA: hypothetical protein VMC02_09675 [Steroidobacteraceae bacterium]|nr:hypothetical protein [Steroidobacteraceae bacterium]